MADAMHRVHETGGDPQRETLHQPADRECDTRVREQQPRRKHLPDYFPDPQDDEQQKRDPDGLVAAREIDLFRSGTHGPRLRLKRHPGKLRRGRTPGGEMLWLIVSAAAMLGGFIVSRTFVRRRLRFVDAVQKPSAPLIAGAAAAVVALPVALLPVVTIGTAVALGVGVAGGVASGRSAPPPPNP